jgi:AraC-like DNA-binding protein
MQFQQRFISMRIPNVKLEIIECDANYQLLIIDQYWKGAHHRAVIDAIVYALCTAFQTYEFVDQTNIQSIDIEFDFEAPNYAEQYQAIGAKRVSFARSQNSILINKANVLSPIKGVDNISFLQAKQMCENALSQQNHKPPIDYLVERSIEKGLDRQDYSIDSVAKQVGMSKRTLHRQLLRRNTNYKQILDAVRKKRILETLSKSSTSVTKLAYDLGYSDLANFRRAFKRIFGMTPQAYLKNHGR